VTERWESIDLERALGDLGHQVVYPPTPDLAGRVMARLEPPPARPSWRERLFATRPRFALAAVLVVILALASAGVAIWPQARTTVAERLGLRGVFIEQVPRLATPSTPPGQDLDLGEPTTLAEAQARLPLLLPTDTELGAPGAVYLTPTSVALVYAARAQLPSVLLLESRLPPGGYAPLIVGKSLGPGTRLEELSVNGGRGVWLEGAPHLLVLPDPSGQVREDRVRLAGNVLLWEQASLLMRLEGALAREQALRIAASVR
jgi:hypothetical protein